jgi:hypothetical protein
MTLSFTGSKKLQGGKRYVIVPAPRTHSITGKFHISVYFNDKLHNVDLKRLNGPRNKYTCIPEETEKTNKKVPGWKIKYVERLIKEHKIIGQEQSASCTLKKNLSSMLKGRRATTASIKARKSIRNTFKGK